MGKRGRPPTLSKDCDALSRIVVLAPPAFKAQMVKRAEELGVPYSVYMRTTLGRDLDINNSLEVLLKYRDNIEIELQNANRKIENKKAELQKKAEEEKSRKDIILENIRVPYQVLLIHDMIPDGTTRSGKWNVLTDIKHLSERLQKKYKLIIPIEELRQALDEKALDNGKKIRWNTIQTSRGKREK